MHFPLQRYSLAKAQLPQKVNCTHEYKKVDNNYAIAMSNRPDVQQLSNISFKV